MATRHIPLAKQIDRVPSTPVPLDASQELRFRNLMEDLVMVDIHQHPMVAPEDIGDLNAYLRSGDYSWGYQAVKHGGWTAVATANMFRGLINTSELSFVDFQDVLTEVAMMLADVAQQPQVVQAANADQIQAAKCSSQRRPDPGCQAARGYSVFAYAGAPGYRQPAGAVGRLLWCGGSLGRNNLYP